MNSHSLIALRALVRKDLLLFFRNRKAVLILFVAPVLIAAFFGSLFRPSSKQASPIPIAIVDQDLSKFSESVTSAISADTTFATQRLSRDEAVMQVRKGKVRAAILLPKGIGADISKHLFRPTTSANKPSITVYFDPSQSMVAPMVNGILAQQVMRASMSTTMGDAAFLANAREEITRLPAGGLPEEQRRDLLAMFESINKVTQRTNAPSNSTVNTAVDTITPPDVFSPPFTTTMTAVTSSEMGTKYNSYAQSFAGMSIQFVLFMGIDLGIALLLARRSGMWKRLRAAPISRAVVLGASVISTTLISMIALTFVFAVAIAVFGVRIEGSVIGFVGILIAASLFTASFGLLLAAIGGNPEATRGLAILATLLLLMLGGAWIPSFIFPEWLQTVAKFLPTHWAIEGLAAMTWRGLGLDTAAVAIAALLGFSAVFALLAHWRFNWEE